MKIDQLRNINKFYDKDAIIQEFDVVGNSGTINVIDDDGKVFQKLMRLMNYGNTKLCNLTFMINATHSRSKIVILCNPIIKNISRDGTLNTCNFTTDIKFVCSNIVVYDNTIRIHGTNVKITKIDNLIKLIDRDKTDKSEKELVKLYAPALNI